MTAAGRKGLLYGVLGLLALSAVAALFFSAYSYYNEENQAVRAARYEDLKAIAELKSEQIVAWRKERMADANIHSSGLLREYVERWLENPGDGALYAALFSRAKTINAYKAFQNIILVDLDGRVLLSLDPQLTALEERTSDLVRQVLRSGKIEQGYFFRCPACGDIHLDVAAPVFGKKGQPVAVLLLRSDPAKNLFPLIQSWPTSSKSAETLFVRRDGNDVLFLNPLRLTKQPALTQRLSLTRTEVPAVQVVLGRTGFFSGRDYRGVRVLADLRPIPGTRWFMVAKVDEDEILSEVQYRTRVFSGTLIMSLLILGVALLAFFSLRRQKLLAALLLAEQEQHAAQEEIRATLYGIGDGVIATDAQGRVTRLNPVAERLTGYGEAEAVGRPLDEVFRIINETTREIVQSPVGRVLAEGVVVGLANHTILLGRDGQECPIADSGAPILDKTGAITGVVLVFRDQSDERAARQALQESEARTSTLFENTPDVLMVVERDGRIREVNEVGCARYGYSREEFRRLHITDFYPPENVAPVAERLKGAFAVGARFETQHRRKDGSVFWVEVQSRPFIFEGIECVLSAVRDISNRKKSEEALYQSELNLRTIFNSVNDLMALFDNAGRFLFYNHAIAEHFAERFGRGDLTGLCIFDLTNEAVRESRRAHFTKALESGEAVPFEDLSLGHYWQSVVFPVKDYNNTVQRLVVMCHNITPLVKSQQALAASEERFRQLVDCAPDAIFVQTKWCFRFLNPAALRLFGVDDGAELLGDPVVDHFHPDFRQKVNGRIAQLNEKREAVPLIVEKILRRDGQEVEVEVSAVPITYEGDNGALVFLRDISERRQAEQERLRLEDQFRQSQKLESIGRLAGGVAHDFNNQLTGILGHVALALNDLNSNDPLYEVLCEINQAAESASTLTRQLLVFSRKQIVEPKVIDLNELVGTMHRLLGRLIGEHITLRATLKRPLGRVFVDMNQIEQLLVNLVVNARDAMPEGGRLTIETNDVTLGEDYCETHLHAKPGDYVMLAVSDTGCGMDEATRRLIFEPFFTTKAKDKGTGLGLATVYGAVKQAGGSIEVYSEMGQGSSFKIYLPSVAGEAESLTRRASNLQLPGGSETVFLVEDEEVVRNLAFKVLKRLGYNVTAFENGSTALRAAEAHPQRLDLLITDVVMPGLNGRALAAAFVALHPECAVLYTSGYTENVIVHHGVLDHGIHFLGKPYTPQSLAAQIRKILDKPQEDAPEETPPAEEAP